MRSKLFQDDNHLKHTAKITLNNKVKIMPWTSMLPDLPTQPVQQRAAEKTVPDELHNICREIWYRPC
uniref:Uncharacterized protein n=1 Tax=Amphiprion percula TaxID=161767 RepID=A0A3P8SGB9_AMPPE